MRNWLLTLCLLLFLTNATAAPRTVYIIRHTDKLLQPEPGPALSAKGELRAIKFAFYFLNKYGEPDFMFAASANKDSGGRSSQRALETLAPLANMLSEKYPTKDVPLYHSFAADEYDKLVKYIMSTKKFDNKSILICWHHGNINKMIKEFGYKDELPEWAMDDFDSIYILQFSKSGNINSLDHLMHEYPIAFNGSWRELNSLIGSL